MKKVLLAGTALVGAAFFAAPAQAELKLNLGGHFKGYGVYVDEDAEVADQGSFELRRNTEIHFTGETTLDNGLTVGVHVENEVENDENDNEVYAYFSGGWGRVNLGSEDGAAYLLQVAAPSADSNVDGLRTFIQGFQSDVSMDYDHAQFGNAPEDNADANPTDRITYLTPKFNGFQAGVSWAPEDDRNTGIEDMSSPSFNNLWELAVRWDGQFEGVGISLGAGYSHASEENAGGADDIEGWNVGANLAWNQFSFGASWLEEEGTDFINGSNGEEVTTWVVGAAWDNGPWHVGASYLSREDEYAGGADVDSFRATFGGGYSFGPGMTFRGALAFGEANVGAAEEDFTQVTLGTDISF